MNARELKEYGLELMSEVRPVGDFKCITDVVMGNARSSRVLLRDVFPILGNATVVKSDRRFNMNNITCFDSIFEGMLAFDTQHNGRVYLICNVIGHDHAITLGVSRDTMFKPVKELAVIVHKNSYPPEAGDLVMIMLIPRGGCTRCKKVQAKMSKCGRCWKEARFPVKYCSKECQISDFPKHKACCGKKLVSQSERPAEASEFIEYVFMWA